MERTAGLLCVDRGATLIVAEMSRRSACVARCCLRSWWRCAALDGLQAAAAQSDGAAAAVALLPDNPPCDGTAQLTPLPAPGSPGSQDFFRAFREPLPPAPLYDPPGPQRVGLQAGHWLTDQVPPELGRLQGGAVGGGKQEWQVNLDIAQRTAALLEAAASQVDVLPSTVPPSYRANAFVALHADGDTSGVDHGFKVARPGFSSLPDVDDRLVDTINQIYGADTGLPRDDDHISLRMRYYYAFNSRRYCHAVAPGRAAGHRRNGLPDQRRRPPVPDRQP